MARRKVYSCGHFGVLCFSCLPDEKDVGECVGCLVDSFEKEKIEEPVPETKEELIKPPAIIKNTFQFVVGDKVKLKHAASYSKFVDKVGIVEKIDSRGIWVHWPDNLDAFCFPFGPCHPPNHLSLVEAVVDATGKTEPTIGFGGNQKIEPGDKVFFCSSANFSRPARPTKENPIGTVVAIVPRGNGTSEAFVDWDDGNGKIRKATIETHYLMVWKKKKTVALSSPCRECHRIICQCNHPEEVCV